ncbi:TIGR02597 family protein [Haloferula sp.]|uniref:TIGR02597 family protein n=1 Tax=Haloferula sp. TaxID=2497595 RepID=UPI003C78DD67
MSLRKPALLLLTAAMSPIALGAEPIYTDPVGFVKLGNLDAGKPVNPSQPDGAKISAVSGNTDLHLTVPLEAELMFSGLVATTTATTLTVQGNPNWADDLWSSDPEVPYCIVIESETQDGLRGLIISTDAGNELTVEVLAPGSLADVESGDGVKIRKCWTISSFFGDTFIPENSEIFLFDSSATGINHSAAQSYLRFGTDWLDENFALANNVMLHPGDHFILRALGEIPTLTAFGDVQTTSQKIDVTKLGPLANAEDIEFGLNSPIPLTVGSLNIPAEDNDELFVYDNSTPNLNKSASKSLLSFGGVWVDENFSDASTFAILPGNGLILRRAPGSKVTPQYFTVPSPIAPNP